MRTRWWLLPTILMIAAGLRLYRIGQVPLGYAWDETSIIYNAWSISVWHRDEFAALMPLSFRSFGDYKAPLVIYLLAGLNLLFGLNEVYLRAISAAAGIATVGAIFFVGRIVIDHQSPFNLRPLIPETKWWRWNWFPYIAAFVAALSGWQVTLSRVGFEQNLTTFFITAGVMWAVKGYTRSRFWIGAVLAWTLALYTFHTAKIFVPIFIVGLWLMGPPLIRRQKRRALGSLGLLGLLAIPWIWDAFHGQGNARASTLIFRPDIWAGLTELAGNSLAYLSPRFWLRGYDAVSLRHVVPGIGVLYWVEFLGILAGLGVAWHHRHNRGARLLYLWLIAGLMPGLLTHTAPHALRVLFAAVPVTLLASLGAGWVIHRFGQPAALLAAVLLIFNAGWYVKTYYGSYAHESAPAYQYGYAQALKKVNDLKVGTEKIVITDGYGQPYIYTLLYNRIPPQQFLFGALNSYEFRPIKWPESGHNRIYIGLPTEIPVTDPRVVETITVPNTNTVVLVIAKT